MVVEDRVIQAQVLAGSCYKGYEDFVVQGLVLRAEAIRYFRERRLTPDGKVVLAARPQGIATQLQALGLAISKRQAMRLLSGRQHGCLAESRAVLRAGLRNAAWISADDTGARHGGRNGYCTQIGNDSFTWFATRPTKSRLNFLDLLRAGDGGDLVNPAALDYECGPALAGPLIERLAQAPAERFADHAAWQTHLRQLGIGALRPEARRGAARRGCRVGAVAYGGGCSADRARRRGGACGCGFWRLRRACDRLHRAALEALPPGPWRTGRRPDQRQSRPGTGGA